MRLETTGWYIYGASFRKFGTIVVVLRTIPVKCFRNYPGRPTKWQPGIIDSWRCGLCLKPGAYSSAEIVRTLCSTFCNHSQLQLFETNQVEEVAS